MDTILSRVAIMLGVKNRKPFRIKYSNDTISDCSYRFLKKDFQYRYKDINGKTKWGLGSYRDLFDLMIGKSKVVKS